MLACEECSFFIRCFQINSLFWRSHYAASKTHRQLGVSLARVLGSKSRSKKPICEVLGPAQLSLLVAAGMLCMDDLRLSS